MLKSSGLAVSGNRRLVDGITMFIVTGLSLMLLVYVGIGEGKRTYEQLEIEKLTSQGRHIQTSIESNLRACDVVKPGVRDVCHGDRVTSGATVLQHKTERPVQFEISHWRLPNKLTCNACNNAGFAD